MQKQLNPQPSALERLLRENSLQLVWSMQRQRIELRPRFVAVRTAGYSVPREVA